MCSVKEMNDYHFNKNACHIFQKVTPFKFNYEPTKQNLSSVIYYLLFSATRSLQNKNMYLKKLIS